MSKAILNFDPHQYTLDHGWDFACIEATAEKGIAEEDERELAEEFGDSGPEACVALLRWCREKVTAARKTWLISTAEALRAGKFDPATVTEDWQAKSLKLACPTDGSELHEAYPSKLEDLANEMGGEDSAEAELREMGEQRVPPSDDSIPF